MLKNKIFFYVLYKKNWVFFTEPVPVQSPGWWIRGPTTERAGFRTIFPRLNNGLESESSRMSFHVDPTFDDSILPNPRREEIKEKDSYSTEPI